MMGGREEKKKKERKTQREKAEVKMNILPNIQIDMSFSI